MLTAAPRLLLATVLLSPLAIAGPAQAEPAVATVFLVDGQTLTAAIDASSNEHRLVLRFESDTATLLRRLAWQRVAQARVGTEELTPAELQARVNEFATVRQYGAERELSAGASVSVEEAETTAAYIAELPHGGFTAVESVVVDVVAANFDADVPVDGLAIAIAPLDAWGHVVAASGTVEIELFGDRRSLLRPLPTTRREQFDRLGRWVVTLDQCQATPAGYVYNLPFEAFNPAETLTIRPVGLVNVRLSIPGQGVYEASASDVRLIPYSPLRNRIEASTGRRYLPAEATGF